MFFQSKNSTIITNELYANRKIALTKLKILIKKYKIFFSQKRRKTLMVFDFIFFLSYGSETDENAIFFQSALVIEL